MPDYNRDDILRRAEMAAVLATAPRLELHCDDGDTWVAVITSSGPDLPPIAVRGDGKTPERALVAMADALVQGAYDWAKDQQREEATN